MTIGTARLLRASAALTARVKNGAEIWGMVLILGDARAALRSTCWPPGSEAGLEAAGMPGKPLPTGGHTWVDAGGACQDPRKTVRSGSPRRALRPADCHRIEGLRACSGL